MSCIHVPCNPYVILFAGRRGSGPVDNLAVPEHGESYAVAVIIKAVVVHVNHDAELLRTEERRVGIRRQVNVFSSVFPHLRDLVLGVKATVKDECRQVGEPFRIACVVEVAELVGG